MVETFQKYGGSGLMLSWFLVSLVYLFFQEKNKANRILFLYAPVVTLVLFFNPLFYAFFSGLTEEAIYFRIFWLLPITVVIGYTVVQICHRLQGGLKIVFGIGAIFLIIVSGKLVYTNPLFEKAENLYHVPQEVVEICDAIEIEGREVMAAFPEEFVLYVRQYSPVVCMPYGREVVMGEYNELFELVKKDTIVVEEMVKRARQYACHYVILSEDKVLLGDVEEFEYEVFGQVGKYVIYKDTTMNFKLY